MSFVLLAYTKVLWTWFWKSNLHSLWNFHSWKLIWMVHLTHSAYWEFFFLITVCFIFSRKYFLRKVVPARGLRACSVCLKRLESYGCLRKCNYSCIDCCNFPLRLVGHLDLCFLHFISRYRSFGPELSCSHVKGFIKFWYFFCFFYSNVSFMG
jgi:hypothetical protein